MDEAAADPVKPPRKRRWPRWVAGIAVLGAVVYAGSIVWISVASAGHTSDAADAPDAPVVIVLGAQIKDGKPMAFLKGRLDAAVELVEAGKAKAVLVSGDANGGSGDEIAAMTNYLVEQGIDERRIVGDPYGLDTYDTCFRAIHTYGVTKALIVTQGYHVPRAVALCRDVGIDADGGEQRLRVRNSDADQERRPGVGPCQTQGSAGHAVEPGRKGDVAVGGLGPGGAVGSLTRG